MPDLSFTLFGPPQIKRGNEQISVQRRKDLALLIYLVSTSQPQSRDTLATLLWQDQTQTEARSNLRKSLSRLKALLGENVLLLSQNQASFNPEISIHLDIAQFQSYLGQFRQHQHSKKKDWENLCAQCQANLEKAVHLYCADFLHGFSVPDSQVFEEWQFFQAESLRRDLAEALEHLTLQRTHAGDYRSGIEYCRKWLLLDRFHEPPHRQLMLLYALDRQQAAALRQFEEWARLLKEELGAEPASETIQLYEAIQKKKLDELMPLRPQASPDWISTLSDATSGNAHNLPVHTGALIGREKELNEIFRLLNDPSCQMLTLLGPGGSGKTRLALQAASTAQTSLRQTFHDGIRLIPLAPVTDTQSFASVLGQGLGMNSYIPGTDDRQKFLAHVRGRQMLLVIDNFEHLLAEETIELISDILEAAPSSKILITSRERLNVRGEYVFRVEGLETPGDEALLSPPPTDTVFSAFGALQLFEQCASRIHPSFRIHQENYRSIAEICQKVEGMPLAIELAAAWLAVFSPEEINQEITRSLDFLQGSWRDLPDRQRSLRAVFDSSWALLDKQTRPILKALSVFRASFTREAAQAIAGASAKSLLDLTNKSWIQRSSNGRYQIHELLKQFVYEMLAREQATLERIKSQYCDYYAAYTDALWEAMKGSNQKWAYSGIEVEFENIQTAWTWLVAGNKFEMIADQMLPVLLHFAELRGKNYDLLSMLERAVRSIRACDTDQQRAEIILLTARGAFFQDAYPIRYSIHDALFPINLNGIHQAWSQAKTGAGLQELGFWSILLAYIYGRLVNLKEGMQQIKKLIPHFQRENQPWELATAYLHLLKLMIPNRESSNDQVEILTGDLSKARDLFDTLGDRINTGRILTLWGDMKYIALDMEGAIQHWKAARELFLSIDEWGSATSALWQLGDAYLQSGNFSKGFECFEEMANVYMQRGLKQFGVGVLSKLSYEKSRHGNLTEAIRTREKCLEIIQETGPEYQIAWNYWEMGELVRISGDLLQAAEWFERSLASFEQQQDNVGRSFYHRGLGDIAITRGDLEGARAHFLESSKLSRAANHIWMMAYTLSGLGRSELALGAQAAAEKHFRGALRLAAKSRDQGIVLVVLTAYAELLRQQGQLEKAAAFASLAYHHFSTWHETRDQAENLLAALKESMSPTRFSQAEGKGNSINMSNLLDALTQRDWSVSVK